VAKTTAQASFIKSLRRSNGTTATIDYSVPTDRFFWDQNALKITSRASDEKPGVEHTQNYTIPVDDTQTVGACVFHVKHYMGDFDGPTGTVKSEVWFSPDLLVVLKSITTYDEGHKSKTTSNVATEVRTSFVPLQ
jgi:hypothetical protein